MKKQNEKSKNITILAILYALAAALFYALNVPCSKLLLEYVSPTMMAAFLYLGAGLGVGLMYLFHLPKEPKTERLNKKDLLDIIAPILLMIGVNIGSSSNATLLGNFEIVATTVIALLIFKESVSRRLWIAIAFITLSSIILTFGGEGSFDFSFGSVFVLGATVCWGFENNCTRKISEKSTYQIVTIKGLCSGTGSMIIALVIGERFSQIQYIALALLLGFVAYGLSIFTYIRAQKTLGAAKTSAYYAVAPFIGAFLSFILLNESLTVSYLIALAVMIVGTGFAVYDTLIRKHTHEHTHTYTQDGITYTVTHSHSHQHVLGREKHDHKHF